MRLSVTQRSILRFAEAPRSVILSCRLTPTRFRSQTTEAWQVTVPGSMAGAGFRDGAGDAVSAFSVALPGEAIELAVEGTVETVDAAGVVTGLRERVPPSAYLRTTRATRPDKGLLDLGRRVLEAASGDALGRAHGLCAAVGDAVRHGTDDETEEGGGATAAATLARGEGSCRAQTHVLMALAIAHGISARFVSGYAFSGEPGDGRTALVTDADAPHVWAELHVEPLGWVGFDPVNACCPDDRYIRVCSGFDAADADPIRVHAAGHATDGETAISVATAATGQAQQ